MVLFLVNKASKKACGTEPDRFIALFYLWFASKTLNDL
ncbi:hypothetical protein SAMN05428971_0359 [Candidatus Pantoea varia]|uniref:Uncharacterized protein n=1 Tax=Candidatus Pantoea varia TaxID=1881036 RepID=A0A1I4WVF3_9GAMM|nr:hypothetical protein SAMN05428971_0359 [Pantoea varia]